MSHKVTEPLFATISRAAKEWLHAARGRPHNGVISTIQ